MSSISTGTPLSSISAPLGNRTNYRVDYERPIGGRPATNKKPRDKINIDKDRKLVSRSNYRKDYQRAEHRDTDQAELYKQILAKV